MFSYCESMIDKRKGVILIQLEDKLKEQQDVQGGHCGVEMCRTELNHEFD